MECETFYERLNDCLDAGHSPSRDRRLRRHALRCRECRSDLEAWQLIDRSVTPKKTRQRRLSWRIGIPLGLAAAVCMAIFMNWQPTGEVGVVAEQNSAPEERIVEDQQVLSAAVPHWSDPEWVDKWADRVSEPFVPLSQGLAPLGRSFQTAVTLLILPGEADGSQVQPLAQPLQSKLISQTSEVSYA